MYNIWGLRIVSFVERLFVLCPLLGESFIDGSTITQANKRYPNQLCLADNMECVYEEDGGILMASKAVGAYQVRKPVVKTPE